MVYSNEKVVSFCLFQSFHLPASICDFYRYICIDFHLHYSHEYYCPILLLRVYGFTHLEQWKWDTWEEESRARQDLNAQAAATVHTEISQHWPERLADPPWQTEEELATSDESLSPGHRPRLFDRDFSSTRTYVHAGGRTSIARRSSHLFSCRTRRSWSCQDCSHPDCFNPHRVFICRSLPSVKASG